MANKSLPLQFGRTLTRVASVRSYMNHRCDLEPQWNTWPTGREMFWCCRKACRDLHAAKMIGNGHWDLKISKSTVGQAAELMTVFIEHTKKLLK